MTKETILIINSNNPSLNYEKGGLSDFYRLPITWVLAFWVAFKKKIVGKNLKINTFWFDGISLKCRTVKENATKWVALDIIYNHRPGEDKSLRGKFTDFWNQLHNIKAIRNRLRLVKQQMRESIQKFSETEKQVRILSVASGSAQGIIELMREFKQKGVSIKAIFLDLDLTALTHSQRLAREAGVFDQITFVNKSTSEIINVAKDFHPHIVEVTGLLEYRPHEKAISLLNRIYNLLTPNGILISSNITHNLEMFFTYWVGNWPMIYRSTEELCDIIIRAGFNSKNCQIIREPLKIHNILVCKK